MRLTTLTSIVVLAVSTTALAQVASTPSEQKMSPDPAMSDNATTSSENAADALLEPDPGAPSTALVNSSANAAEANGPPR